MKMRGVIWGEEGDVKWKRRAKYGYIRTYQYQLYRVFGDWSAKLEVRYQIQQRRKFLSIYGL